MTTISCQDSYARQTDQIPAVWLLLHDHTVSVPAACFMLPDRHLAAYAQLHTRFGCRSARACLYEPQPLPRWHLTRAATKRRTVDGEQGVRLELVCRTRAEPGIVHQEHWRLGCSSAAVFHVSSAQGPVAGRCDTSICVGVSSPRLLPTLLCHLTVDTRERTSRG